jgi:AcrR family transcriptional regulator
VSETIPSPSPTTGGRERILEEAFDRFIMSGFAAVSMQQIADGAGVTKATLYHHFRDKEDLFLDVMRTGFARSQANLSAAIERGDTLSERLRSVARYLFSAERADLARLMSDLHQHVDPSRHEAFWRSAQQPWACLETAIADGVAAGEIAPVDPGIAARVFFGAIVSQLQFARYHGDVAQPDEVLAEQIVDLLMNGLESR